MMVEVLCERIWRINEVQCNLLDFLFHETRRYFGEVMLCCEVAEQKRVCLSWQSVW